MPAIAESTRPLMEPAVVTLGELAPNVSLTSITGEVKTIDQIRAGKPLILVTLNTYRNDPKLDLRDQLILKRKLDNQVAVAAAEAQGLVGFWQFNGDFADSTSNHNDGQPLGDAHLVED